MKNSSFSHILTRSLLVIAAFFFSCKQSAFLEKVPDQKLILPVTIADYQAILDANNVTGMNNAAGLMPGLGDASSDEFYCLSFINAERGVFLKKLYLWQDDFYTTEHVDWMYPYRGIYYCNVVLDGLSASPHAPASYAAVQAQARFHRAHIYFELAQVFTPPYQADEPGEGLGLPLRATADVNEPLHRASVHETYRQIIRDLEDALPHLPAQERYKTRPSQATAHALLARVYLAMGQYETCLVHATASLDIKRDLMDFNTIQTSKSYPIERFNAEVLVHSMQVPQPYSSMFLPTFSRVDSTLIGLFTDDDLRKTLFFKKETVGYSYRGSYTGDAFRFRGLTTSEVLLMRSECYARLGQTDKAMDDLNALLESRFRSGTFIPLHAANQEDALAIVLRERRKELAFRGLRWMDLRRLNSSGANITLKRNLEGNSYTLAPNDPRYTFPIPPDVMGYHSDWKQNPR